MARGRPVRQKAVLQYPPHWFTPEELLSFIELRPFTRRWDQLGLDDMALELLQVTIMTRPKTGDVVEGTGGLRKMRFVPPRWEKGKSGALRVCYAYFEDVATVVLALVYDKGEKDDLSAKERAVLRDAVGRVERRLLSQPYRCSSKPESED